MNQCKRCGAITVCVDCYPDSDAAKAMAGLPWTDAKPTVPGWYWYRIRDSFPSRIVELRNLKHGGNVEIYVIGHGLLDYHEGQFAGPIPTPKEKPCTT